MRVAMLQLTDHPPRILLTDHVDGDRPILVYRVASWGGDRRTRARGWTPEPSLKIPQGPVSSYRSPADTGSPCTSPSPRGPGSFRRPARLLVPYLRSIGLGKSEGREICRQVGNDELLDLVPAGDAAQLVRPEVAQPRVRG